MIEILPYRDKKQIEPLFIENKIEYNEDCIAIKATDKDTLIGYALFSISKDKLSLFYLETFNDFYLVDGIVRSALHVGVENGVTEAYCENQDLFNVLKDINFIKNEKTKEINIDKLFESCCGCK